MGKAIGIVNSVDAEADNAAPSAFVAPSAGGVTVTSTAATDLDDTSAAVVILVTELGTLTTKVNNLLAKLRLNNIIDS